MTTVFSTAEVEAGAGTELSIWFAAVVTDDPAALTELPTADATGAAVLVLPEDGEEPVVPLPAPGELPGAAGETGVPVKVAGPTRVTCPPGSLPEPSPPSAPVPDDRPPDPAAALSDPPGAVEPVDPAPEVWNPLSGRTMSCFPCAETFDRGC